MQLLKNFDAQAIIFDKDGTLIDFDAMWGTWTLQLADRLQASVKLDVRAALCESYGYDINRRKILPDGKLTCTPMWELRQMMVDVVQSVGLSEDQAQHRVEEAWFVPDPVILAKPFTDVRRLFTNIHRHGIKIAIATTDDRKPTEAMLEAFGVSDLIASMICADDGIRAKPAPDMVTTISSRIKVNPSQVVVVGDTVADMQMARSAGAGYVIGVLSGVGLLEHLTPLADILIDNVHTMQESFVIREHVETPLPDASDRLAGLNPDPAY